jgi:hypothetical protein
MYNQSKVNPETTQRTGHALATPQTVADDGRLLNAVLR